MIFLLVPASQLLFPFSKIINIQNFIEIISTKRKSIILNEDRILLK